MSEANKQLIYRWFEEVWNQGRTEAIAEMFADEGIAYGLSDEVGQPVRGPREFEAFHAIFRQAFPDITVSVDDAIAEGDLVAARCSVRGKHTGHSLGVAATNAPVEFTGMSFVRIKGGKIVEAWNNFDFLKMYRQIGAL